MWGAELTASGTGRIFFDDLVLTASRLPTHQFGLIFMGTAQIGLPFGDGKRCVGGSVVRFNPPQNSGAAGSFTLGPGIANYACNAAPSGCLTPFSTWNFQAWYRDPTGPCGTGFNTSNALAIIFTP
jgi:hypothetical protein